MWTKAKVTILATALFTEVILCLQRTRLSNAAELVNA